MSTFTNITIMLRVYTWAIYNNFSLIVNFEISFLMAVYYMQKIWFKKPQ